MKKFMVFMAAASVVGLAIILVFNREARAGKAMHEAEAEQ